MKITYDPEADVLYIILRDVPPADGTDIEEGVSVEVDESGHITALEIIGASERMTKEELGTLYYENLSALPDENFELPARADAFRKARKPAKKPARVGSARARK